MSTADVKRIRKLSAIFVFIFILLFPGSAMAGAGPYAEIRESAARICEILVNDHGVNSLQYALLCDNEIILQGTAGKFNKGNSLPVTDSSIYGIGSTSKMFTTVAVMLLLDQGKLDLDKPITSYVPDFVMADARYKEITVRMLLNHSSGLMGSTYTNGCLFDDPNTFNHDILLTALAGQRLKADPGAYSVYCNDGFTLAELVVERVSGLTFSEFVSENITKPLGLSNTATPQDDFDRGLMARTFVRGNETPPETLNIIGSGGIYSTASELCLFGQIFMDNPGNDRVKGLLSPAAKKALMEKEYLKGMWPNQKDSIFGYGLGFDSIDLYPFNRYGIRGVAKGGDTPLYHSSLIVLPEQNMAFAVVMSGGSSMYGELMGLSLLQQTLLAIGEIDSIVLSDDEKTFEAAPMPTELISYAGLYKNNGLIKEIRIEPNGMLTVTALTEQDLPEETFIYQSSGEFVNGDRSKRLSFTEEKNGETYLRMVKVISLPGLEQQMITTTYDSVKMLPNPVDSKVQRAWDERSGIYYIVNEIRSSQCYYNLAASTAELYTNENLPGYFGPYKIDDINNATQDAQIPVMDGRDNDSLSFTTEDGKEYLSNISSTFLSGKNIPDIYAGADAICTIQQNGYARWYSVGKGDAGKTMTVKLPHNGAFAVYDSSDCIYFSTVSGNQPVILPAEGKIVFIGDVPGTRFYITID
jgi:CubicO group peptidase (beta-lactamase class C family)